jgi:hypothetical protein
MIFAQPRELAESATPAPTPITRTAQPKGQ